MEETVTMQVEKDVADTVAMIQVLKECGTINVSDEAFQIHELWENIADNDKIFFASVIREALGSDRFV